MSDKNPISGLLSALGLSNNAQVRIGTPEELLETLKGALPADIVKSAEEMADRILGSIPQEVRDYKNRVSDLHNQFHEVGAEGEQTYSARPATVNAIMFDGENFTEVAEFMRKHDIGFGVKSNRIMVDSRPGAEGLGELETGTFIVVRNVTEDNPIPAYTFMGCMQFMMGYDLPVDTQRQEQSEQDVEDDALTEQEQEIDEKPEDDSVTKLEADLDKGDVYPSDAGGSPYRYFHG